MRVDVPELLDDSGKRIENKNPNLQRIQKTRIHKRDKMYRIRRRGNGQKMFPPGPWMTPLAEIATEPVR